jgi:hypothetical protein
MRRRQGGRLATPDPIKEPPRKFGTVSHHTASYAQIAEGLRQQLGSLCRGPRPAQK